MLMFINASDHKPFYINPNHVDCVVQDTDLYTGEVQVYVWCGDTPYPVVGEIKDVVYQIEQAMK